MNDFQKGILKAILTSQLSIEKAALDIIMSDGDEHSSPGFHLVLIQEAKINEIKKQLFELEN